MYSPHTRVWGHSDITCDFKLSLSDLSGESRRAEFFRKERKALLQEALLNRTLLKRHLSIAWHLRPSCVSNQTLPIIIVVCALLSDLKTFQKQTKPSENQENQPDNLPLVSGVVGS